ncbi:MAG: OadG family protein [Bacteroidota bacterium]
MSNELYDALTVLVVGMLTVFTILLLVVWCGQLIIRVVNALHRPVVEGAADSSTTSSGSFDANNIDKKQVAAIVAAVQQVTQGKGQLVAIEKLED